MWDLPRDIGCVDLGWRSQQSLVACRPFRKLEKLECCGNGVGDEGVKELIWLQSLQHLCLAQNPRISDKSSLFLSGLARLRTLNLTGTQLTNNGILPLRALTVSDPSCTTVGTRCCKLPHRPSFSPDPNNVAQVGPHLSAHSIAFWAFYTDPLVISLTSQTA